MLKAFFISALSLCFAAGVPTVSAEQSGMHMYEAAKADPALSAEFQRITKPVATESPWVLSFGTTSPSTIESVNGQAYDVFWGCKPHDCITESYAVLYDRNAKRIMAGAFVRNMYNGPALTESHITWLGRTEFDYARALGKYLY
ncbi:MAG TPA: Ivy family c-type lysozyme inhibitor [Eoetvoesiella sp.]